jgi:hypothetical protein
METPARLLIFRKPGRVVSSFTGSEVVQNFKPVLRLRNSAGFVEWAMAKYSFDSDRRHEENPADFCAF